MINKKIFFSSIRKSGLFSTLLTQKQVDGINCKIDEFEKRKLTDKRWLAYILATSFHETGRAMQPVEEYGKGKGHSYGKKIKRSGIIYSSPDKIYYGRGDVQLTWYENYELMGRLLGLDLLKKPELALVPENSTKIMFEGMLRASSSFGDFTGKCLEMYFNSSVDDPIGARRIINGKDRATYIAGIHYKFLNSLKLAA